jgi:hypothetical protein
VIAKLGADQINRHRRTAEHRGFNWIIAVAIAPRLPSTLPADTVLLEWQEIYAWLCRHGPNSMWADRTARYLEIAEAKLIDSEQFAEGTLTKFSGFPFWREHPFTYLEGKRVLELALNGLRQRRDLRKQLKMDPNAPGRPAITGRRRDSVWDFLPLAAENETENFTHFPHLTLSMQSHEIEATLTIPHAVKRAVRRTLIDLGENGFQLLMAKVVKNLKPLLRKCPGATPRFRGLQRRYPSQRAAPFIDARIDFDLRTAVPRAGPPKAQPQWLTAA